VTLPILGALLIGLSLGLLGSGGSILTVTVHHDDAVVPRLLQHVPYGDPGVILPCIPTGHVPA